MKRDNSANSCKNVLQAILQRVVKLLASVGRRQNVCLVHMYSAIACSLILDLIKSARVKQQGGGGGAVARAQCERYLSC